MCFSFQRDVHGWNVICWKLRTKRIRWIASSKLQTKPKSKWSHFLFLNCDTQVKIKSERAWKWKAISWLVFGPNSCAFMFAHMEWLAFCNETNQNFFMLIDANFCCLDDEQLDNLNKREECWWNLTRMGWKFYLTWRKLLSKEKSFFQKI